LVKKDAYVETTTKKIARQLVELYIDGEVDKKSKEKIQLMVNGVNLDTYLQQFQWDEAKYKISSPLSDIVDAILSTVAKLEEELRTKAATFQTVNQGILAEKRKKSGNLLVRDLTELIKPDENYVNTENLGTVFVIVPKHSSKEFEQTYEGLLHVDDILGGAVIPRSATKLAEDQDNELYSVMIFKRYIADWKKTARAKKFTVRDFVYDPASIGNSAEETKKLENKRIKQKKNLIRWCRLNFAEAFIDWTHIKCVRVFVETILRYGLPAAFTAVLIQPARKQDKKLRTTLDLLYKGIGSVYMQDDKEDEDESEASQNEKFFSYVWTPLKMGL